jgi:hypothetical protein
VLPSRCGCRYCTPPAAGRFGARVDQLAQSDRKLQQQRESLITALQDANTHARAEEALAGVRAAIREVIDADEVAPKKALISALVQEVEVRSRSEIYPAFRVPRAEELDEGKFGR